MISIDFSAVQAFFKTNWGWATGLAGAVLALTAFAASILNADRKETIALWLMGAQSEENWAKSFTALFDAVFGENHLSLRCFVRSSIASLIAVGLIWALMGIGGAYDLRLQADLALGEILALALAINLLADYLSLLETRWLLGWLAKPRPLAVQVIAIVTDFLISAAIIWVAIFGITALLGIESDSFAEILGVFSVYSVLFYSTFLTSVWSWGFIASTWVLRLFTRGQLSRSLDVEGKPLRLLGLTIAAAVFAGCLAIAAVLRPDDDGLTALDQSLCSVFGGEVCLGVANLTSNDERQFELTMLACGGDGLETCIDRGLSIFEVTPDEAARLWRIGCAAGASESCANLGILYVTGRGVALDAAEAARLFELGCDGGSAQGCTNLGRLNEEGLGRDIDLAASEQLYQRGCELGSAEGCTRLGALFEGGLGVDVDLERAAHFYDQACSGDNGDGCTALGLLYFRGRGRQIDHEQGVALFQAACRLNDARGCYNLGYAHHMGFGAPVDVIEAARLYQLSCEAGDDMACTNLGTFFAQGVATPADPSEAARLYRISCEGGNATGCANLGSMFAVGQGMQIDLTEAARLFRLSCDGGYGHGCRKLGLMHEQGLGVPQDITEAARFFRLGCNLGALSSCARAAIVGLETFTAP